MSRRRWSERSSDEDAGAGIDLTPLIDMVFILLIFFMVTTTFIRESSLPIQRPQASSATASDPSATVVTIGSDEQIWLGNEPIDLRRLRDQLLSGGTPGERKTAIILADRDTRTGLLVQVMDQVRLAGYVEISVAASRSEATED